MHRPVALTVLATATVLGMLGCAGAANHTTDSSTFSSRCANCEPRAHPPYRAAAVRAAFTRVGLRLRMIPGHFTLNSVPHVSELSYSVAPHITASGTPSGGPYFEIFMFRNAPAAKRALAGSYVAELRLARKRWRRLSNVVLVARLPVIQPNRNRTVWRRAVMALESLAH
jgi:hypothetical protein